MFERNYPDASTSKSGWEPNSRLTVNSTTGLPSVGNFSQFGSALSALGSDEEAIALSASMGDLSRAVEAVSAALLNREAIASVGPHLVNLLTCLRKHRMQVVGLSPVWRESSSEYFAPSGPMTSPLDGT